MTKVDSMIASILNMLHVQFKIINIPFIINNKQNKNRCYYFIKYMIHKKLKSYFQYKVVNSQPQDNKDNNRILLKLKALSKSAEKARQKSKEGKAKNKQILSETFSTLAYTGWKVQGQNKSRDTKITGYDRNLENRQVKKVIKRNKKEKEKFQSLNTQILELQNKMKVLFKDKEDNQLSFSREKKFYTPTSKSSMEANPKHLGQSCRLREPFLHNEKLIHIRHYHPRSSSLQNILVDDPALNIPILKAAKILSIQMLKNLKFSTQEQECFDRCENIKELFECLESTILKNVYNQNLLMKRQLKIEEDQRKKWEKIQTEHLRTEISQLKGQIIEQKRRHLANEQQIKLLTSQTHQQGSQIHRLKVNEQKKEQKQIGQKKQKDLLWKKVQKLKKQNQKILLEFNGKVEQHNDFYSKLKEILNKQIQQKRNIKSIAKLLIYQIDKCEKEYFRICQQINQEKEEKKGILLDKCLDLELYQDQNRAFKEIYIQVIEQLIFEIQEFREVMIVSQKETPNTKQYTKFWKNQEQLYGQDYLRLNHHRC